MDEKKDILTFVRWARLMHRYKRSYYRGQPGYKFYVLGLWDGCGFEYAEWCKNNGYEAEEWPF